MNKLEVGMYVRINDNNRIICIGIGKISKIVSETIYVDMNNDLPISFEKNQINKASHNIIDLIEVGDYVNGSEVVERLKETIIIEKYGEEELFENNIKSIVTKEQFSSMEYRLGE